MTDIIKDIETVTEALRKGDVVGLPTETVYGLAASIYHDNALDRIFELKKRPSDNPLIVHCLDLDMVLSIAHVTDDFLKLYHAFMPGPLTVLLEKKQLSDKVTRGQPTVAVRIPNHPLFLEVLKLLNQPVAAPSANLSGKPSSTEALHVYQDFHPDLSYVLDGGCSTGGLESTIIGLDDDQAVILRPGLIGRDELEKVLNKPVVFAAKNAPLQAPGMKYRHYAPKAVVEIKETHDTNEFFENTMYMSTSKLDAANWEMLSEKNLYRAFRLADKKGLEKIVVFKDPNLSVAIVNRLEKAAFS